MTVIPTSVASERRESLVVRLQALFAELSGMDAASLDPATAFLELGLDSLFLTQAALLLRKTFGVKVSFREFAGNRDRHYYRDNSWCVRS